MKRERQFIPNITRTLSICLIIITATVAGCARAGRGGAAGGDDDAERLALRAVRSLGGRGALDRLRYLRFDYAVVEGGRDLSRRSHWWDRRQGRYRFELHEGTDFMLAVFNLNTRQGAAWRGTRALEGAELAAALDQAMAYHRNDTLWLLGALRLTEPGARVAARGRQSLAPGAPALPAVELWFEPAAGADAAAAAAPPRDHFLYYLDEATGRPAAWSILRADAGQPPETYLWSEFGRAGRLTLPVRFDRLDRARRIEIRNLYPPNKIDPGIFQPEGGLVVKPTPPPQPNRR